MSTCPGCSNKLETIKEIDGFRCRICGWPVNKEITSDEIELLKNEIIRLRRILDIARTSED